MAHRVLVTYASKRGGTAEIAAKIAQTLHGEGIEAEWIPVSNIEPDELKAYDAVIIGSGLYGHHWLHDATRFTKQFARVLERKSVWMFSSGPLDDSASRTEIPPIPQVQKLMKRIAARDHVTFGGRLAPDAQGFPASAMAKTNAGDWRNWEQVQRWAQSIARRLQNEPVVELAGTHYVADHPAHRWLLAALCAFVGVTALAGGIALIARPDGSIAHFPPGTLEHTPFASFLVPGILLAALVGVTNLVAGVLVARRSGLADHFAFAGGAATTIWIVTQIAMIRQFQVLQIVYLVAGIAIMAEALGQWFSSRSGEGRQDHLDHPSAPRPLAS